MVARSKVETEGKKKKEVEDFRYGSLETRISLEFVRESRKKKTRFWRERKDSSAVKLANIKPRGEVIYLHIYEESLIMEAVWS